MYFSELVALSQHIVSHIPLDNTCLSMGKHLVLYTFKHKPNIVYCVYCWLIC